MNMADAASLPQYIECLFIKILSYSQQPLVLAADMRAMLTILVSISVFLLPVALRGPDRMHHQ